MEYIIFNKNWLDIPIQDYPAGKLAICHDPQNRLGNPTWAVVYVNKEPPPEAKGLFWDKEEAIRYAEGFSLESQLASKRAEIERSRGLLKECVETLGCKKAHLYEPEDYKELPCCELVKKIEQALKGE